MTHTTKQRWTFGGIAGGWAITIATFIASTASTGATLEQRVRDLETGYLDHEARIRHVEQERSAVAALVVEVEGLRRDVNRLRDAVEGNTR